MARRILSCLLAAALSPALSGCAGLAKGVTQAVIESREKEKVDTRKCHVRGAPFEGLEAYMERQEQWAASGTGGQRPVLKLLMVHGIGAHSPGYATRLSENLARALALSRTERSFREFRLASDRFPGEELGSLRIMRFVDAADTREMLFYELTWDPIVEDEKQSIAYDNSGAFSFRRAQINNAMKLFVNNTVPDVMMYQGTSRGRIQASVGQSMCWMFSRDWASLPDGDSESCDRAHPNYLSYSDDDYAFLTHSLGSRIMIDSLQAVVQLASQEEDGTVDERVATLRDRRIPVFMLSNQLPLLQLGQTAPAVYDQMDQLCRPESPTEPGRLFDEIAIVAFSDPNDLMSYAIPRGYLDRHMDSRLCPSVVNVILNVAEVISVFGLGEVANPMTAHLGYDDDERVIGLITYGIGTDEVHPLVAERCEWMETF
jgi:hypothetical protein